jgi:hypothetical protein
VNLVLSLPLRSYCLLACALSHPLVIRYPTVYHDETYFVVVDPLRQPLASKSDRRPVGTLHQAPAKMTSATTKAALTVAKPAVQAACAKPAPQHCSLEVDEDSTEADHHTSVPPRNPRHILEAADGSDNMMEEDAAPEQITIKDDGDKDTDTEDVLEESAEAELSAGRCSCVRG